MKKSDLQEQKIFNASIRHVDKSRSTPVKMIRWNKDLQLFLKSQFKNWDDITQGDKSRLYKLNFYKTKSDEIFKLKPHGVFLSNGPGDPAATGKYAIDVVKNLIQSGLPLFGICLGHQILALALNAKTRKMKLGHRGANHPVKNLITNKVEITSQNHGFEVIKESLKKNTEITHLSLFDNSIEGIRLKNKPVFSVQYHPEANPGPQDSKYLFSNFMEDVKKYAKKKRY